MKATVWTKQRDPLHPRKCIFNGHIAAVPGVGAYVVVREGFCAEQVEAVLYDLSVSEIEITVSTTDPEDEYPAVDYD